MNKDYLVEIFVAVGDDDGGYIATGYPVADNRIITAHHALFPEGKTPASIEVRWYHQAGELKKWQPAQVVDWEGSEDFDVALLECACPVAGHAIPSEEKPKTHQLWESEGFPEAGKRDEQREPVAMKGTAYNAAENANYCELDVDGRLQSATLWQGASGSPVFVGDNIIAVILSSQAVFSGSRFKAAPTWKLLAIPEFCQAIGYQKKQAWRQWAHDELLNMVQASTKQRRLLAQQLNIGEQQNYQLVEQLLADDPAVFTQLNRIFFDLAKTDAEDTLQWLRDVLAVILPTRLDAQVLETLQKQQAQVPCISMAMPVATPVAAEMAMAGLGKRAAQFIPKEDVETPARRKLKAKLAIDLPPEMGIDEHDDKFIEAFKTHLLNKLHIADDLLNNHHVDNAEQLAAINDELEDLAASEHWVLYFIYSVPTGNAQWQSNCAASVKRLKDLFPSIIFINLTGSTLMQERRDYIRPLRKVWKIQDID